MNTFWLKVAGIVVLVLVVVVAAAIFAGRGGSEQEQRTIYDQWEQDEQELRAKPQYNEPPPDLPPTQQRPQPTGQNRIVTEPVQPQFKELTEEERIEAERLWEMVMTERKMGRLPGMTYKRMVDYCRQIIQKWPESEYAFYAKRALADLSERYRKMYNITDEEIDLENLK